MRSVEVLIKLTVNCVCAVDKLDDVRTLLDENKLLKALIDPSDVKLILGI